MWRPYRRNKPNSHDAEEALQDASRNLARIKKRTPEVKEVSRESRIMRERNHFREQLETIMILGGHS